MNFSETQQSPGNVGFRSSTQPTYFYFLAKTYAVLNTADI
ncbi:hypothetical protein GXM_00265 [Nostoc sphaeroides CCNUC1]|uniref:Uncharacterized protein n=1 Tax=Nostoc sphaeroides CCNUC1 TaxID=2653204 RepID=A0A5P8VQU2_9NOSO|nr:hypothetical protein GXM_00265 [Nostoc sphaeroides CCNUC1]